MNAIEKLGVLLNVCTDTVMNDERFAQTGVGWRHLFSKVPEPLSQRVKQNQSELPP